MDLKKNKILAFLHESISRPLWCQGAIEFGKSCQDRAATAEREEYEAQAEIEEHNT